MGGDGGSLRAAGLLLSAGLLTRHLPPSSGELFPPTLEKNVTKTANKSIDLIDALDLIHSRHVQSLAILNSLILCLDNEDSIRLNYTTLKNTLWAAEVLIKQAEESVASIC